MHIKILKCHILSNHGSRLKRYINTLDIKHLNKGRRPGGSVGNKRMHVSICSTGKTTVRPSLSPYA